MGPSLMIAWVLHRTTRKLLLTQDGQAFYERCTDALAAMDELQTMFQQKNANSLKGRVRIGFAHSEWAAYSVFEEAFALGHLAGS